MGTVTDLPQPWLEDSLLQLDLRERDRCLVLTCPTRAHVAAVSGIVGRTSTIVVVEPDRELAELAAEGNHENLDVLNRRPRAGDHFGMFDALLACPLTTMGWDMDLWSDLIVSNLRPGGRFVLDLPAETFCEPLRRAWLHVGGPEHALAPISGDSENDVAEALRSRGLRNVEASLGTYLARLDNPFSLASFMETIAPEHDFYTELGIALVEDAKTHTEVDMVFHRVRVHGLRRPEPRTLGVVKDDERLHRSGRHPEKTR